MGLILARQRSGIETLLGAGQLTPFEATGINRVCDQSGNEFIAIGTSQGYGTCSADEYHGQDVLVLVAKRSEDAETHIGHIACAGIVLERLPTDEEQAAIIINPGVSRHAVQAVIPQEITSEGTLVVSLGDTILYPKLITGGF